MRAFLAVFLILVIGGCAKQSTTSNHSVAERYKKLAYESLNVQQIQFFENEPKDYVLATYRQSDNNLRDAGPLNYVIINISADKVEKKGVLPQGKINWVTDYEVEIFSPPGMPQNSSNTSDDYKSRYNVKTGEARNQKGAND